MDIAEIKNKKKSLEESISKLVIDFSKETDIIPKDMEVSITSISAGTEVNILSVRTKVKIEI